MSARQEDINIDYAERMVTIELKLHHLSNSVDSIRNALRWIALAIICNVDVHKFKELLDFVLSRFF